MISSCGWVRSFRRSSSRFSPNALLCRYVLRPPVAQERLALTPDGLVLVTLKSEWHDGTSHLLFTPVELLEKLAALTPRPRINLVLYHGILAPARGHGRTPWRRAPPPRPPPSLPDLFPDTPA